MQMSFFDNLAFPQTFEELLILYNRFLREENEDNDAFMWNELSTGGRAYSFYGQKVFEYYPGLNGKAKFKLPGRIILQLPLERKDYQTDAFYTLTEKDTDEETLVLIFQILRKEKQNIFRNTVTEIFGCCNDFIKCSDQKQCIHPEDRFYNGCMYRKNLEAGRIFYGKNRNI